MDPTRHPYRVSLVGRFRDDGGVALVVGDIVRVAIALAVSAAFARMIAWVLRADPLAMMRLL